MLLDKALHGQTPACCFRFGFQYPLWLNSKNNDILRLQGFEALRFKSLRGKETFWLRVEGAGYTLVTGGLHNELLELS